MNSLECFLDVVALLFKLPSLLYNSNGLFDLAATAGLETQSTYILYTEHKKI